MNTLFYENILSAAEAKHSYFFCDLRLKNALNMFRLKVVKQSISMNEFGRDQTKFGYKLSFSPVYCAIRKPHC